MNTEKVTRVEIIDDYNRRGRSYVFGPQADAAVELALQDNDRTLKIYIVRGEKRETP
jgi:hypothetical protein